MDEAARPFPMRRREFAISNQAIDVLDRDAEDSLATMELVLAQPAISSQLIDNFKCVNSSSRAAH